MEIISTIINEVTDVNISLTSPLLKTKVLAIRLQNQGLLKWVNNELTGYNSLSVLPSYRKTIGEIYGDYVNGNWHVTNQIINFPKLGEKNTERLYSMHFCQSIQTLEVYNTEQEKWIGETFNDEQKRVLYNYLESQNKGLQILRLYRRIPSNFILEILSIVRDKLLEFMLQLEQRYNYVSEIKELKSHNKEITKIMATTIFNNGDGNILNTGSNNSFNNITTINEGNKADLKEQLLKSQVPAEDIDELLKIIDLERPKSREAFGNDVTTWIRRMINKAFDGTWQIGIGAAGEVLATALQQYYGIY